MAYTVKNFKTKKALKEAVEAWRGPSQGSAVCCYQPGLGPDLSNYTGTVSLEGPHAPSLARFLNINGVISRISSFTLKVVKIY